MGKFSAVYQELEHRLKKFNQEDSSFSTKKDHQRALELLMAPVDSEIPIETLVKNYPDYRDALPEEFVNLVHTLKIRLAYLLKTPLVETDKTNEFFIAIAKMQHHSFVLIGVMQRDGSPFLLARIGKIDLQNEIQYCPNPILKGFRDILRGLFSTLKSCFASEPLNLTGDITYSAYSITYDHYLQMLDFFAMAGDALIAYQNLNPETPSAEESNQIQMDSSYLVPRELKGEGEEASIIHRSTYINLHNTCRHSGIELVEFALKIDHLSDNVPRQFFMPLPLAATFENGKTSNKFYLLPPPPETFEAANQKVLAQVYRRMEKVPQKDPESDVTFNKFKALKKLYLSQAGIPKDSIREAIDAIDKWRTKKWDYIHPLRAQSFFGKIFVSQSSTAKMAKEIQDELGAQLR